MELFNVPKKEKVIVTTCKDCIHKLFIEYTSGKRFYYCSKVRSRSIANGFLKIRLKSEACFLYKNK